MWIEVLFVLLRMGSPSVGAWQAEAKAEVGGGHCEGQQVRREGTKDMQGWREGALRWPRSSAESPTFILVSQRPLPILAREAKFSATGFLMVGKGLLGSAQCRAEGNRRDHATF